MRKLPPGRIPSLDGLRAVSITFVLVSHLRRTLPPQPSVVEQGLFFLDNGRLGVVVFFVISGYLITRLLRREQQETGRISLSSFYARRTIRIFPAFYLYVGTIAVLSATGVIRVTREHLLAAGAYLWNYRHVFIDDAGTGLWYLGHTWSLSLEEQFYLLWPLTVVLVGLLGARRAALAVVLLAPVSRVVTYLVWPESRGAIGMMLHTAIDGILIGGFVALVEGEPWFERAVARLRNGVLPAVAVFVAVVIVRLLAVRYEGTFMLSVGMTVEVVCIAVVMMWAIRYPDTLVGRVLNAKPLMAVGVLSYSLYLWQQLFLAPYPDEAFVFPFPFNLLAAFAAATASYWLVEKPFLRLRARLRHRKKPLPAQQAAGRGFP